MIASRLLILVIVAAVLILAYAVHNGIGPMPTTRKQRKILLDGLPAPAAGTILELGSGWGTLAAALARQYPDCRVIGYENSPVPLLFSKCLAWWFRLPNLEFHYGNIYRLALRNPCMIVCYLYPAAMNRLKVRFEKELNTSCRIVTNTFAVPGWHPQQVIKVNDLYRTNIYVYDFEPRSVNES